MSSIGLSSKSWQEIQKSLFQRIDVNYIFHCHLLQLLIIIFKATQTTIELGLVSQKVSVIKVLGSKIVKME